MRTLAVLLATGLAAGCAAAPQAAVPGDPEPARARAALATVYLDNRTAERVTILYRLAARPATEVGVGTVAPRAVAELAPVPAGEPVILIARTASGGEFSLPPRSFLMDTEWTWLIEADTPFVPPAQRVQS